MSRRLLFFFIFILLPLHLIFAQPAEEPLADALKAKVKSEVFNIGMLLQFNFDYQNDRIAEGENQFTVANARMKFSGKVDQGFSYTLQLNFASSPAALDAYMKYMFRNNLGIQAGLFKVPFSYEYLTSAANTDFINRSTVVNVLAPKRQVGVMLTGYTDNKLVNYQLSVTNGTRQNGNDNGYFMLGSRVEFHPVFANAALQNFIFGINLAHSKDAEPTLDQLGITNFASGGTRTLYGADVRFSLNRWLFSSEFISATLNPQVGETVKPYGFHFTTGYYLRKNMQLLARYDYMNYNLPGPGDSTNEYLVLGWNYWTTSIVELQANYIIDTDNSGLKHHRILFNFQVAF